MPDLISVADEVAAALEEEGAVVALETTLVAHGFPAPHGVEVGLASEAAVRAAGAVPATVGVLDGTIRIGLSQPELERFTASARKLGPRDLAVCAGQGAIGATTVGGTLAAAAAVGIRFMGTGGLGGVHRGAPESFDVSADLTELSQTDVTVVSAGVKSILDIGLTLEKLETLGVPVLVEGSDEFPSFFSRSSGYAAPMRVDGAEQVAAVMRAKWDLGIAGGVVVAQPIPVEDEIPASEIDGIIAQALADMDDLGITGKDATPYLLGRIVEITGGASLTANIALVRANARLGAAIARAYAG